MIDQNEKFGRNGTEPKLEYIIYTETKTETGTKTETEADTKKISKISAKTFS